MCCETNASRPRVRVTVFLRSAPAASTLGPSTPRSIGSGTKPRARREIGGRAVDDAHHRIVGAHHDRAPVGDDEVGDAGEAPARVLVVGDQRLAAEIGAGGDQRDFVAARAPAGEIRRARQRVQHQPMQRRIGEHQADVGEVRRDAGREDAAAAGEHDRPRARFQQRALRVADLGEARRARRIGDHHGKGFGLARLAAAQRRHRRLVARVANEVEAAEPLERDDAAARGCSRRSPRFRR